MGDIESLPFLEAIRQVKKDVPNRNDVIYVHVTLVPYIAAAGETENETNPAQCQGTAIHRYPAGYHRVPHRRKNCRMK